MTIKNWEVLSDITNSKRFIKLIEDVKREYALSTVYPPFDKIFDAFKYTSYRDVKVVILGQDPYHNEFQANGLAFSVEKGVAIPPSLKNIFKEIRNEYPGIELRHGDLGSLAKQGVFLLNTIMSVRAHSPMSHSNIGWQEFTDAVIQKISQKEEPVCFMLWGSNAQKKEKLIDSSRHLILKSSHPSPLSAYRGFFGCNHFKLANDFIYKIYGVKIDWSIF